MWLDDLRPYFAKILFIDSGPYIKTVKRQRLGIGPNGRARYRPHKTEDSFEMRALFLHNARAKLSLYAGTFGQEGPIQSEFNFDVEDPVVETLQIEPRGKPQLDLF